MSAPVGGSTAPGPKITKGRVPWLASPRPVLRRFLRIRLLVAALVAAVGATALGSQAATPGVPSIYVDYNTNCTFSMSVDPGTPVVPSSTPALTVPPGTYQLLIAMPNPIGGYAPCSGPTFTLTGPGVSTQVVFVGQELHEEHLFTFQPSSTYVAQEESAPAATRRSIATSATGSSASLLPSATPSTASGSQASSDYVGSAILRYRGKLAVTVSSAGKATLRQSGRAVASLKTGRYDVVVDDEDTRAGFSVRHGIREAVPVTGVRFKGKRTKRMALTSGSWTFSARPGTSVRFTVAA